MILKRQSGLILGEVSSTHPLAPIFPNSNRNTLGNRNRRNASFISDLNFSNRNKIRGVAKAESEEFTNLSEPALAGLSSIQLLALPCPPKPALPGEGGGFQNLIATQISRSRPNSPDINETYPSNRNKSRGATGRKARFLRPGRFSGAQNLRTFGSLAGLQPSHLMPQPSHPAHANKIE
jgi:hypothetical protein